MVVLHPDHVASLDQGGNDVGETHVGFPVSEPMGSVKVHLPGVIVEQWPEDRVGETYRKKKTMSALRVGNGYQWDKTYHCSDCQQAHQKGKRGNNCIRRAIGD